MKTALQPPPRWVLAPDPSRAAAALAAATTAGPARRSCRSAVTPRPGRAGSCPSLDTAARSVPLAGCARPVDRGRGAPRRGYRCGDTTWTGSAPLHLTRPAACGGHGGAVHPHRMRDGYDFDVGLASARGPPAWASSSPATAASRRYTVADVVPLVGDNRVIAPRAQAAEPTRWAGLQALVQQAGWRARRSARATWAVLGRA
jgi:hypothetical protein